MVLSSSARGLNFIAMNFGVDHDTKEFLGKCLPAWEKFLDAYENVNKLESLGRVEIKNALKVANELEDMLSANKGYSSVLRAKLEERGKLSQEVSVDRGRKACDVLLTKFLLVQDKKANCKEWAVDEYVDLCGKERLKSFIESLLHVEMSHKVVLQYIKKKATSDSSGKFSSELGLRILAAELKKLMHTGDVEGISMVVAILMDDENNPGKVLELLLLKDDRTWNEVKHVILETIVKNVDMEVKVSCSFWQALAVKIDGDVIARVCMDHPVFLGVLLKAIMWSGNRLRCEYCPQMRSQKWVTPGNDACVLQFQQLVGLVRSLLASGGAVAKQTHSSIETLRAEGGFAVWDDVLAAART